MAASVSGSKTASNAVNPTIPAATMNTLFSTAVENLTVAQFNLLKAALACKAAGEDPNTTIGSLFA